MDVHKYENIIHVTLSLNPFPRERDLPSLRSNFSYFISLIIVALPGSFFMDVHKYENIIHVTLYLALFSWT